jgi:hypothetical protein
MGRRRRFAMAHEQTDHVMAGTAQQMRRDAAIHSARHGQHDSRQACFPFDAAE